MELEPDNATVLQFRGVIAERLELDAEESSSDSSGSDGSGSDGTGSGSSESEAESGGDKETTQQEQGDMGQQEGGGGSADMITEDIQAMSLRDDAHSGSGGLHEEEEEEEEEGNWPETPERHIPSGVTLRLTPAVDKSVPRQS